MPQLHTRALRVTLPVVFQQAQTISATGSTLNIYASSLAGLYTSGATRGGIRDTQHSGAVVGAKWWTCSEYAVDAARARHSVALT